MPSPHPCLDAPPRSLPPAAPRPWRLSLLLASLAAVGCGAAQSTGHALTYGQTAEKAYRAAMNDFPDDCIAAEPEFRKIRRNFPYSRYAALAELRGADCMMKQGNFAEAVEAYRQFIRYRPSHPKVPYARFKIAEGYFKQIPTAWLLSPPAYERDQGPTRQALAQLRRFLLDYSNTRYAARARKMERKALAMLAHHELYVARFYLDRGHPRAAVLRLRTLLNAYTGSGVEPEALLLLGRTYLQMNQRNKARNVFRQLLQEFPRSGYAPQAQAYLSDMGSG